MAGVSPVFTLRMGGVVPAAAGPMSRRTVSARRAPKGGSVVSTRSGLTTWLMLVCVRIATS